MTLAACLAGLFQEAWIADVAVLDGARSDALPVVCGVLADSAAAAVPEDVVWLEDGDGNPVPAMFHRRPGRRILHAALPAASAGGRLRVRAGAPAGPAAPRIQAGLEGAGREAWIDTGAGRIRLGPGTTIHSVSESFTIFPEPAGGRWSVVHRCPLRVELLCEGRGSGGSGSVSVAVTVAAHAGADRLEIGLLLEAADEAGLAAGAGIAFGMRNAASLRLGDTIVEGRPAARRRLTWSGGVWWEDGERVAEAARGVIGIGRASAGWLVLPNGREEGFENLEVQAGGGSAAVHWAGPGSRLARGEGRIFRALLGVGPAPPSAAPMVLPRVPASAASALAPGLGDGPGPTSDPIDVAAAGLVADFLADPARGLLTSGPGAGDWRMDRDSVGNLEYDTVGGLLGFAASARVPAAFAQAQASADHLLGEDVDRSATGLFFEHGPAHRSGRVEAGHHWLEGPLLLDLWLDDPLRRRVLGAALERQIGTFAALDLSRQFPRSLGWGLRALAAGATAAPARAPWIREVRRWRRRILGAQARSGILLLAREEREPHLFAESPFVQGGILAPALAASTGPAPDAEATAAAARLARFLAAHAILRAKDGWRLAETLVYDARAGSVAGRSGRVPGEEAALFLAGVLRACPALAGDSAVEGLRRSIPATLGAERRRFIGRELSLLLRALPGLRTR